MSCMEAENVELKRGKHCPNNVSMDLVGLAAAFDHSDTSPVNENY